MRGWILTFSFAFGGCAASVTPAREAPGAGAAPPAALAPAGEPRPASPGGALAPDPVWDFLREKYDADEDGRIERREYRRGDRAFAHLDADADGAVTTADFAPEWSGVPRTRDFAYGEGGPELGDPAPDFRLPSTSGEELALSSFRGKKPVVLVFGSFT